MEATICFDTPDLPPERPIPTAQSEEAKQRRKTQAEIIRQSRGRQATIVTSPLGDPGFGENVTRTTLGGF